MRMKRFMHVHFLYCYEQDYELNCYEQTINLYIVTTNVIHSYVVMNRTINYTV